jgi:dipeptidyl aminopeptidase/acylaminoacyl peptidase
VPLNATRVARNRKIGAISLSAALAVGVALFVLDGSDATDQRRETNQVAGRTGAIPSERGIYLFDLGTRQATRVADILSLKPTIAVSPDGTTVAYQAMGAVGQEVIYLANVDGTHVRALKETAATGEPIGPRFSPDGSQIVFQAKGSGPRVGNLFLIDVGTGQTTQLTHLKQLASGVRTNHLLSSVGPFGPRRGFSSSPASTSCQAAPSRPSCRKRRSARCSGRLRRR